MSSDRSISRLNGTYTIENIIRDNASGVKLDKWKAKEVKDDTNDRTNTASRIRCQNAGPGPLYILTCKAKKRYLLTAYFSSKQILCFSFGIDDVNTWRSHAYSILTKVWTNWPFAAFVTHRTNVTTLKAWSRWVSNQVHGKVHPGGIAKFLEQVYGIKLGDRIPDNSNQINYSGVSQSITTDHTMTWMRSTNHHQL